MDNNSLDQLQVRFISAKTKEEVDEILLKIISLLPNNYDLGEYLRKLYSIKSASK